MFGSGSSPSLICLSGQGSIFVRWLIILVVQVLYLISYAAWLCKYCSKTTITDLYCNTSKYYKCSLGPLFGALHIASRPNAVNQKWFLKCTVTVHYNKRKYLGLTYFTILYVRIDLRKERPFSHEKVATFWRVTKRRSFFLSSMAWKAKVLQRKSKNLWMKWLTNKRESTCNCMYYMNNSLCFASMNHLLIIDCTTKMRLLVSNSNSIEFRSIANLRWGAPISAQVGTIRTSARPQVPPARP